jgi:biopolymer transport protein ExbB
MDFTLAGLWHQMGPVAKVVVVVLIGMSIYAIGIAFDRWWTFRKSLRKSVGYITALQPLVAKPGKLSEALGLEKDWKDAPVGRIIGPAIADYLGALEVLGAKAHDPVEAELLIHHLGRSMERGRKREVAGLQKGLSVLATIASSAPFVGLFGTVFGIITAFQQMADPARGGSGSLASVSGGIAEALLTTAVGLVVAIVSVWFYNYFVAKADDFANLAEETSGELVDGIVRNARSAKAH